MDLCYLFVSLLSHSHLEILSTVFVGMTCILKYFYMRLQVQLLTCFYFILVLNAKDVIPLDANGK
jgi:hypothetical protein